MLNKTKKMLLFIMLFIFCFSHTIISYADEEDPLEEVSQQELEKELQEVSGELTKEPQISSKSVVIYDRESKRVIYGKEENTRRPMASTTKILTAVLVLENAKLTDTVEISKKSASINGSRLGLKTGDKITVQDLLHGLMLKSRK